MGSLAVVSRGRRRRTHLPKQSHDCLRYEVERRGDICVTIRAERHSNPDALAPELAEGRCARERQLTLERV